MRIRRKKVEPVEVLPVYQTLFKAKWIPIKGGGFYLSYDKFKVGVDLVRPVLLEEIKPKMLLYRRHVFRDNEYYPMFFYPEASWETIQDEFKTGRLFIWQQEADPQE